MILCLLVAQTMFTSICFVSTSVWGYHVRDICLVQHICSECGESQTDGGREGGREGENS